jgi:DNA-directed RNA polymerase subunit RPC12/RpoP
MPRHKVVYECVQCGDGDPKFRTLDELDAHLKTYHGIEKPYVCTTCSKAFAQRHGLVGHVQGVHRKFRKFNCDCGVGFHTRLKLDTHLRKMHSVYTCDKCQDRSSTSEDALRIHKISHLSAEDAKALLDEAASGMGMLRGGAGAGGAGAGELADRIARIRF